MFALEFPPLGHIVDWPGFAGTEGQWYEVNKVVLVYLFAVILTSLIFFLGNKKQLVPSGAQNLAEISVEFVEEQIIEPTIGHTEKKWLPPFMLSLFFYIFFTNIFEVIPIIQMPGNARIALPMFLALLAYVIYHGAGFKEHGLGYIKHALIPPGVPVFLLPLVALIEFVSKFLVQPFSHTVRLFANLLAGHILLVTFAILSAGLWTAQWYAIFLPLPAFAMVFFTAFEVMVSFLQAYVFTLLFGVYFGAATSHEH
ncbi:F0F1 ATP synthase subunit A [Iamia majanohamensis]|uniref:ATP synthase subunit a n=1 Tax=Iamia majanohamensis TaxID=467976 RepID=A0AAE9Y8S4_9ACTN|nr:F0F1 ATP synthase subunit A [Iamia majanohamensis]WCO66434.1 F0F1 ATP synthase subunit A [Iamia majanohamensis]